MIDVKTFTIDRSKWRTGGNPIRKDEHPHGETQLLNGLGYMCCLGFFSLACGLEPEQILNEGECKQLKSSVIFNYPSWFMWALSEEDDPMVETIEDDFISINDDPNLSDDEREARLTEEFAKYGVKVVFTGEYDSPERNDQ